MSQQETHAVSSPEQEFPNVPSHEQAPHAPHAVSSSPQESRIVPSPEPESEPVDAAAIAHQIHRGQLHVHQLAADQRQQCVGQLTDQGYSTREIAQLLGMHDRTVRRDRSALRRAAALEPDLRLGDEMLGEYQKLALDSIQRLIRMAGDPKATAASRLRAENAITQTYHRLLETVHRMKYLSDGQSRLADQRENDPVQLNAYLQYLKAEIQKYGQHHLALLGASDDPDDQQREIESTRQC